MSKEAETEKELEALTNLSTSLTSLKLVLNKMGLYFPSYTKLFIYFYY